MATPVGSSGSKQMSLPGKKRRFLSRSDEEVVEEMDMELKYRQGWPTLPNLPLLTEYGNTEEYFGEHFHTAHIPTIKSILESQRVEHFLVTPCHRVHTGCEPDELTATLLVLSSVGSGSWFHAIKEIRKYLAGQALDIAIEFIDRRAYGGLSSFTILPSETKIINFWLMIWERIRTVLNSSGQPWSTVDVLYRGLGGTREECFPTIIISTSTPSDTAWRTGIIPAIRQISLPHLHVELLYGCFVACVDERDGDKAGRVLTIKSFQNVLSMGTSCGPQDGGGSGTLGGAITLHRGEQNLGTFALTNGHVIRSQRYDDAILGNQAFSPEHPLAQDRSLVVRAPSDGDLNVRLAVNAGLVENYTRVIDGFEGDPVKNEPPKFSLRLKVEMGQTSKIPLLEKQEKEKKSLEQESSMMENFDRDIGTVYAASGYRKTSYQAHGTTYQHCGLDWALIRLGGRQMYNLIEATAQDIKCPFPIGRSANMWGKPELGGMVAKRGRTTDWTVGELNAIESVVVGSEYGGEISCIPILGKKGPFADLGDLGAVVLEVPVGQMPHELKWVGLLFAAAEVTNIGYMIPMDLVVADIRNITGCDVVEPEEVGTTN
ncbi:MAG: hypothetical protein M1840_007869 [Geoglossum simile]|nr:MAG: hypothetical protein M1840_007869 [Geoglossum simile]